MPAGNEGTYRQRALHRLSQTKTHDKLQKNQKSLLPKHIRSLFSLTKKTLQTSKISSIYNKNSYLKNHKKTTLQASSISSKKPKQVYDFNSKKRI